MTADERLALKWLHGDDNDRRLGIEPGRAALIRLLENPPLSNPEICRVMARAFANVAAGEMRLTLSSKRGPGRPRKDETVKGLARGMNEINGKRAAERDTLYRAKKMFRKRPKPRKPLLKQAN